MNRQANGLKALAVLLSATLATCVAPSAGAAPLFENDSVIDVTLTGPLHSLLKTRKKELEELPFTLTAEGVQHEIGVRVRGHSRREVCAFPPLRLNFKKSTTADTVFAGQDKLKLVTHCNRGEAAEQDAVQEYSAYRIFNLLTPGSYRARLMRITYVDTEGRVRGSPLTSYGFVREPDEQLATRLGGNLEAVEQITRSSLDGSQAALVYVTHYLIGNTDWSLVKATADNTCCHNGALVKVDDRRLLIPFDFDNAGLVNPRYAKPDPSLRIRRVTKRLYRGYCLPTEDLSGGLDRVYERKDDILELIRELPGLTDRSRSKSEKYLERFFRNATDQQALLSSFEDKCL